MKMFADLFFYFKNGIFNEKLIFQNSIFILKYLAKCNFVANKDKPCGLNGYE